MVGTQRQEPELEIYGREFEKRVGYARAAPLVHVATLNREEELIEWSARIDTGACISTFPGEIMCELPPLALGPSLRLASPKRLERDRTYRLPMLLLGDEGSWYDCPRDIGFLDDDRDQGIIGMDVLQDLILVVMGGKFWLLHPDLFTVNILRR